MCKRYCDLKRDKNTRRNEKICLLYLVSSIYIWLEMFLPECKMESGKILATLFGESNGKNGTKRLEKYWLQVEQELIPAATAM